MQDPHAYRKYINRLRNGDCGYMVTLHVGGTNNIVLPRELLTFIPYFALSANKSEIFVPYKYDEFKAIIDFVFDPDGGLHEDHSRAWRFFFCAINISETHMLHVPEALRIPVENIVITYNDWDIKISDYEDLFRRSQYFAAKFKHNTSFPYTGDIVCEVDNDIIGHILDNEFDDLGKFTADEVIDVVNKYGINFEKCLMCSSIQYCDHRRIFENCDCKLPVSEKCTRSYEMNCKSCGAKHRYHGMSVCHKCVCKFPNCRGVKKENGGNCNKHVCEHINEGNCTKCFCQHIYSQYQPEKICGAVKPCKAPWH